MHDFVTALVGGFFGVTSAGTIGAYFAWRFTKAKALESIQDFHKQLTAESKKAGACLICSAPIKE